MHAAPGPSKQPGVGLALLCCFAGEVTQDAPASVLEVTALEIKRLRPALQVFLTPTHLAIAMEYAKGGNLFQYVLQHAPLCRLTETKAQWIFQQLVIGLDYCHCRVCILFALPPTLLLHDQFRLAWLSEHNRASMLHSASCMPSPALAPLCLGKRPLKGLAAASQGLAMHRVNQLLVPWL